MERLTAAAENEPDRNRQNPYSSAMTPAGAGPRPSWFRWYVCVLLLLATTINYMDRQTLANAASHIKHDFQLTNESYGEVETWFGLSFAVGALLFGFVADRANLRLLYPGVLIAWSLMGIATGSVTSFVGLLACRSLLGLFESGHWPCALITTQRLLPASQRTLGNSILQSGSSIGAIFTPLVVAAMLTPEAGSWRLPFQIIGALGIGWVVLWLAAIRPADLRRESAANAGDEPSDGVPIACEPLVEKVPVSNLRRFAVLVVVVVSINACFHLFRVWLPLFLQEGRGYDEKFSLHFTSLFYFVTDIGCFAAGGASIALHRLGVRVGFARWMVFGGCSLLTASSILVPYAPQGPLLLGLLLVVGAGALGLFPCYYALSQELSVRHLGKVTGTLSAIAWVTSAPLHKFFGRYVDQSGSYDLGIAMAGCLPLIAVTFWLLVWDWKAEPQADSSLNRTKN